MIITTDENGLETFTYAGVSLVNNGGWRSTNISFAGILKFNEDQYFAENIEGGWWLIQSSGLRCSDMEVSGWPGPFASKEDAETFLMIAKLL